MNHPASGYVQAINDFASPILLSYLIDAALSHVEAPNDPNEEVK